MLDDTAAGGQYMMFRGKVDYFLEIFLRPRPSCSSAAGICQHPQPVLALESREQRHQPDPLIAFMAALVQVPPVIIRDRTNRAWIHAGSALSQRREHSAHRDIVALADGAKIAAVTGAPVLKKPMVAFADCGGALESKRKLYKLPQRNTFAFWFSTKVCELHVNAPEV